MPLAAEEDFFDKGGGERSTNVEISDELSAEIGEVIMGKTAAGSDEFVEDLGTGGFKLGATLLEGGELVNALGFTEAEEPEEGVGVLTGDDNTEDARGSVTTVDAIEVTAAEFGATSEFVVKIDTEDTTDDGISDFGVGGVDDGAVARFAGVIDFVDSGWGFH